MVTTLTTRCKAKADHTQAGTSQVVQEDTHLRSSSSKRQAVGSSSAQAAVVVVGPVASRSISQVVADELVPLCRYDKAVVAVFYVSPCIITYCMFDPHFEHDRRKGMHFVSLSSVFFLFKSVKSSAH